MERGRERRDCLIHSGEHVLFFCAHGRCFMPLCEKCLPQHSQYHNRKNVQMPIQSIADAEKAALHSFEQLRDRVTMAEAHHFESVSAVNDALHGLRKTLSQGMVELLSDCRGEMTRMLGQSLSKSRARDLIRQFQATLHENKLGLVVKYNFQQEDLRSQVAKLESACSTGPTLPRSFVADLKAQILQFVEKSFAAFEAKVCPGLHSSSSTYSQSKMLPGFSLNNSLTAMSEPAKSNQSGSRMLGAPAASVLVRCQQLSASKQASQTSRSPPRSVGWAGEQPVNPWRRSRGR